MFAKEIRPHLEYPQALAEREDAAEVEQGGRVHPEAELPQPVALVDEEGAEVLVQAADGLIEHQRVDAVDGRGRLIRQASH